MKNQVLTIEQMQELIAMGVDVSNASMCYGKWNDVKKYSLFAESKASRESFIQDLIKHNCVDEEDAQEYAHETIPTFTLQDILEMLPNTIEWKGKTYWFSIFINGFGNKMIGYRDSELWPIALRPFNINGAFYMLKCCKENNFI